MKRSTRWFLHIHNEQMLAAKVGFGPSDPYEAGDPLLREVVVLSTTKHLDDGRLVLPSSYAPHMKHQYYTVVSDSSSKAYALDSEWQLWFFGPNGVEMRRDKGDVAIPYHALNWYTPLLGDFTGMHAEGPSTGEGSTRIVWQHEDGYYMVLKVFDDHWSKTPKGPATLKFWRTDDIQKAFDSWTSSAVEFDPNDAEMDKYMEILDNMLDGIPLCR